MIREYNTRDLETIRSFHERSFPLIIDEHNVINLVSECNGITGFLSARETVETILVIDRSRSKRVQAHSVMELIKTGIMQSQKLGLDETHAFLTGDDSESWLQILQNKFGAQKCKGIPIVLNLEGFNGQE